MQEDHVVRFVTRALMLLSLAVSVFACVLGFMLMRNPLPVFEVADTAMVSNIPESAETLPDPIPAAISVPPETVPALPEAVLEDSKPVFLMTEQDMGNCVVPSREEVIPRESERVFRWTDDTGRVYFGDRPPQGAQASLYEPDLPTRMDFFDMDVINRGAASITFLQDMLQSNVTASYETLSALVGQERLRRVDLQVVIFPERTEYLEYAKAITSSDMSGTSGFYTSATNEAVTYLHESESETLEVARHEATHVIIRAMLGDPPPWLNEGLAEYFSMLKVTGTFHQVGIQPQRLQEARLALANGYPASLSAFVSMRRQQWSNERISTHYAIAWGLVYFLMGSQQGRDTLATLMKSFADNYCTRVSSRRILDENWPGGLEALETEFYSWIFSADEKRSHVF